VCSCNAYVKTLKVFWDNLNLRQDSERIHWSGTKKGGRSCLGILCCLQKQTLLKAEWGLCLLQCERQSEGKPKTQVGLQRNDGWGIYPGSGNYLVLQS